MQSSPNDTYGDDGEASSESLLQQVTLPDGTSAIDITAAWNAGSLVLNDAGTYVLSGDVDTSGMLSIAAPSNAKITLDFAGHKATVKGEVYAGINVSDSIGEVSIKNSSYSEGAPDANLIVEGNRVQDALCGIQANYAQAEVDANQPKLTVSGIGVEVNLDTIDVQSTGSVHDAFGMFFGFQNPDDQRRSVDVQLQNTSVSVSLRQFDITDEKESELASDGMAVLSNQSIGVAYGIYSDAQKVSLCGVLSTQVDSSNNTCDLYSTKESSFAFDSTSELQNAMRAYAAGNEQGYIFAEVTDDFGNGSTVLANLENATDTGTSFELKNQQILFVSNRNEDTEDTSTLETISKQHDLSIEPVSPIGLLTHGQMAKSISLSNIDLLDDADVSAIVLGAASLELWAGDGAQEVDVAYSGGSQLAASSDNEAAVTAAVADGKLSVTPVGVGSATVTVSAGADSATLSVDSRGTWETGGAGYADFASALAAASGDGAIKLMRDLPGGNVTILDGSAGPYTVDLAGHSIGYVYVTTAGSVSLTSSEGRGTVVSTGTSGSAAIYHNSSKGAMTVSGVDVSLDAGESQARGVYNAKGTLSLDGASVTVTGAGAGDLAGVYVPAGVGAGAVSLTGGSVTVTQSGSGTATALSLTGHRTANRNPSLTASGTSAKAVSGGDAFALSTSAAPSDGRGAQIDGCDLSASTTGSGSTAAAVETLPVNGRPSAGGTVEVSGGSLAADAGEGGSAYALYAAGKGSVLVDGGASLSGSTASVRLRYAPSVLSLGAGFSAAEGSVSVLADAELTDGVFATVAEGGDAAAAAAAFVPAASDERYAGMSAQADGQSLKWASAGAEVKVPQPAAGLVYSGQPQAGLEDGDGYTVVSGGSATAAGDYTAVVRLTDQSGSRWDDGQGGDRQVSWSIAPAELTAAYEGEEIEAGAAPALAVSVTGFVGGESAETAEGYEAPTVSAPELIEAGGEYSLTPSGGKAANYTFSYVPGTLKVRAAVEDNNVSITIHSNYPDDSVAEQTIVLTGKAGQTINPSTLERFTYDHWSYGTYYLIKDSDSGNLVTSSYRCNATSWVFPDQSIDLFVPWSHNSSELSLRYYDGSHYGLVTYTGYEGDPIVDSTGAQITSFPATVNRTGYKFLGWQLGLESSEIVTDPVFPSVFPAGSVTYQQIWTEDKSSTPSGENMDLYPLLTNDDGTPKSGIVRLDKQGSWYLSQSVEGFTGRVVVSKPGDYEIDLRGNSIGFGSIGSTTVLNNCALRLGGDGPVEEYENAQEAPINVKLYSSVGQGSLTFTNAGGIQVGANSSLEMKNIDATKTYTLTDKITDYSTEHVLSTYAKSSVNNESSLPKVQNISIDSCNLTLDLANQVAGGSSGSEFTNAAASTASAVLFSSPNTNSISVKDSNIVALSGKPNVSTDGTKRNVNAVAMYVRATSTTPVVVEDSSLKADAQQGSAYSIVRFHYSRYAPEREATVKLQGSVKLIANGRGEGDNLSVGFLNTTKTRDTSSSTAAGGPGILDGTVSFETAAESNDYALLTDSVSEAADSGFQLGENFKSDGTLPVSDGVYFAMEDNGSYTDSQCPLLPRNVRSDSSLTGSYIASFGFKATEDTRVRMAGYLENGLAGSSTYVDSDEDGLKFDSAIEDAEATITRDGVVVSYGVFEKVASTALDGDTVVLNKDLSRSVTFAVSSAEKASGDGSQISYTVDLNGHSLRGFACESNADVVLKDSTGAKSSITITSGSGSVIQRGNGILTVQGLTLSSNAGANSAYGVSVASGTLVLDGGTTVTASSSSLYAFGAVVEGGSLNVKDASISAVSGYGSFDAIGVQLRSATGSAIIGPSGNVVAAGYAGAVYGAKVDSGSLTANGSLSAEGTTADAKLYGVYGGKDANMAFDSASIGVKADAVDAGQRSSMTAWNIFTSGSLSLDGTCLFTNVKNDDAMHIHHEGGAFMLGNDFQLSDVFKLNVESSGLANDNVFAKPAEGTSSIADKAGLFAALASANNAYAGFTSEGKDGSIAWAAPEGAVASTGGKQYASIQAAINAAEAGATVSVLQDYASMPLSVDKDVTLDLNGHSVSIGNGAALSGVSTGISVTAGRLTVKDSGASRGSVVLGLETSSTIDELRGMAVESGGSIALDGCDVYAYGAGDAIVPTLSALFISVDEADGAGNVLELSNGACVHAASNAKAAGLLENATDSALGGARNVVAVNVSAIPDSSSISIGNGCTVDARSTLSAESAGEIITNSSGRWNIGSRENELSRATVRKFNPAEDSALYEAIVKKFKSVAKYDETASDGVYGAHIYYAAPMEITEGAYAGTYVWAFSKPVSGADIGKDEYIVPDVIYIQSTYQNPADAYGIVVSSEAIGHIEVACAVNAVSQTGNACAVDVHSGFSASGSVDVLGSAQLKASTEGTTYFKNTGENPNLNEVFSIGDKNVVFYPKETGVNEVVLSDVQAIGLNVEQGASKNDGAKLSVTLHGGALYAASGQDSADVRAGTVKLADDFTGDGIRLASPDGKNKVGSVFASSATGANLGESKRDAFADVDGELMPVLSNDGTTLEWGGPYSIDFLDSYGTVIASKKVSDGYAVQPPSSEYVAKPDSDKVTYTFVGWSTDSKATADSAGIIADGAAFVFNAADYSPVNGKVTLYPVYRESAKPVMYTFVGAYNADGSSIAPVKVEAKAGAGMSAEQLQAVPVAQDYGTMKFVGWKTSIDKKGSMRVVDPDRLGAVASEDDMTFTAEYVSVESGQRLVVFKVEDYLYGYSAGIGEVPTFRAAAQYATGSSDETLIAAPAKTVTGENWVFSGYNNGKFDYSNSFPETAEIGASATLPTVAAGDDPIFYTAVFKYGGKATCTVMLHYYADWGPDGSPSWEYNVNDDVSYRNRKYVSYGTDLSLLKPGVKGSDVDAGLAGVEILDYAAQTADGSWRAHKFLGWSVRKTDKQAMADLPLVGMGTTTGTMSSSTAYYAIYSDDVMGANVTFSSGDSQMTVKVPSDGTLEDAVSALAESEGANTFGSVVNGEFQPSAPNGKKFVGWTAVQDGSVSDVIGSPALSKLANATTFDAPKPGDGRYEGSLTYYAVFADADKELCNVTIESGGADNWQQSTYSFGNAVKGEALPVPDGYQVPHKAGYAFTGWNTAADGSGTTFELGKDAVDVDELTLYAQYEPIAQPAVLEDGTGVDASSAYISKSGALGADKGGIALSLTKADDDDSAIALGDRDRAISYYTLKATAMRGGSMIDITDQLEGTISISLPVPEAYADKTLLVFVKTSDGGSKAYTSTVSKSGSQASAGALATVNIEGIGSSSLGNITLAWRMTMEEYALEYAKENAVSQLEEALAEYSKGDYTEDNWDLLESAATAGASAINACSTTNDVQTALQTAVDAMASVPSIAGLDTAKAEGLERLAQALASYDKAAYSDDAWATLTAAYDSAKQAVSNATTASAARKAASDGVLAMANVRPDGGNSSSSAGNTGAGATGSSSGSSTSGLSSGSAGRASGSGGLSSTSGGGLASSSSGLSKAASNADSGLSSSTSGGGLAASTGPSAESMLGGALQTVDADLSSNRGLSATEGVLVESVEDGGPLDQAGIEEGDVIVAIDGKGISSLDDLEDALAGKSAGDQVAVTVDRNGQRVTYTVTLGGGNSLAADAAGGLGSNASPDQNDTDQQDERPTNWIPALFGGLAIIAGIAALVWWLIRRRNNGDSEEDDSSWEEATQALQ